MMNKVIVSNKIPSVNLQGMYKNVNGVYSAVFNTTPRYVQDSWYGNNSDNSCSVYFLVDGRTVGYKFEEVSCDYALIIPLKNQYVIYFLEDMFEEDTEIPYQEVLNE